MRPPLSRRAALQLSSATALGALLPSALTGTELFGQNGGRDLLTRPITVPTDFVGMHFLSWPVGKPTSPAPTYRYGAVRSHDYGIGWKSIHTAPNVFDWSRMDAWVQFHASHGKTLIYTIYGTPGWAAAMQTHRDPYGGVGSAGPPNSLNALAEFVQALVSRYNGRGKRQIHYIETWNEPHFQQTFKGFWWGTPEQLAAMGRTIYQAAKKADPGIRVISPAFDDVASGRFLSTPAAQKASLYQYLTASDGAGGVGSRWCDAISIHTYDTVIATPVTGIEGILMQVRDIQSTLRLNLPIFTTELGFINPKTAFVSGSLAEKAALLRRHASVQAALGVKAIYFYAHDDEYIGNPSKNPEIAKAINDIALYIAGGTLRQVTIMPDGHVSVTIPKGILKW